MLIVPANYIQGFCPAPSTNKCAPELPTWLRMSRDTSFSRWLAEVTGDGADDLKYEVECTYMEYFVWGVDSRICKSTSYEVVTG